MKHTPRVLIAALSISLAMPTSAVTASKGETVSNAYLHLGEAMDEWASPPALRVLPSYHGGVLDFWDNSVAYDDALMIIAYADREDNADSLDRARTMGDTLLQIQKKDSVGDRRLKSTYESEYLFSVNGVSDIQTWRSASGSQAQAGMVLAHLTHVTKDTKCRDGALHIKGWLLREAKDTHGRSGFTGGCGSSGTKIEQKSTERSIDMVGLFGIFHQLTKGHRWRRTCKHTRKLVKGVWDKEEGCFRIETKPGGITTNRNEYTPKDVQSWDYLTLRLNHHRQALNWSIVRLKVTDNSNLSQPVVGVRFVLQIDPDYGYKNDSTVWLEGTAHMAPALRVSDKKKYKKRAKVCLDDVHRERLPGSNADGKRVQANSGEDFSSGDDKNHTGLHTGTTARYIMTKQEPSPFHLTKN